MSPATSSPTPAVAAVPAHDVERLKLGVLVSGSGSNLQAIIDATMSGFLDATIAVVVADREDAFGLERARRAGIPAVYVDRAAYPSPAAFNAAIRDALLAHGVEPHGGLVVMAGYMRLLGTEVLDAFPMRVLNLHPALLPSFPGAHAIQDAFDHGVKLTGVTVHFADAEFDRGPILAQAPVKIFEDDTVDSLADRVHEVEHAILPASIQLVAQGRVRIEGRRVVIE